MMDRINIFGNPGSPYTKKIISYFRYKNIPYSVTWGDPAANLKFLEIEAPRIPLLPTVLIKNKNNEFIAVTDTTPLIREFEESNPRRSVIPKDPVMKFINYLIEDYADEWITKFMFHYRWAYESDIKNAKQKLVALSNINIQKDQWEQMSEFVGDRQVSRRWVVGSNDETTPFIESNYKKFLQLMEDHLSNLPFLFGKRPSSADFAIYGQLEQLIAFEHTSRNIAHDISMRSVAWVEILNDLSGLHNKQGSIFGLAELDTQTPLNNFNDNDDGWLTTKNIPSTLVNILNEIGLTYVPYLFANAKAVMDGKETFDVELSSCKWHQQSFKYQAKCLGWIIEEFNKLNLDDKNRLKAILEGTGCELLVEGK